MLSLTVQIQQKTERRQAVAVRVTGKKLHHTFQNPAVFIFLVWFQKSSVVFAEVLLIPTADIKPHAGERK